MKTTNTDALHEARKALRCLYIAADEHVAKDVTDRVETAFAALVERSARLRALLDEATEALSMIAHVTLIPSDSAFRVDAASHKTVEEFHPFAQTVARATLARIRGETK